MTGEGIAQALLTGRLASEAVLAGGGAPAGPAYEKAVAHELFADHRLSLLLSRALSHRKGVRIALRVAGSSDWTHVNAAAALADATAAPVALHPDDEMLWDVVQPTRRPDMALSDGQILDLGGVHLRVLHTPGHSPGGVCLHLAEAGVVFSGDTLFAGGPGATGRSYSDFGTIIRSIRSRLLTLPLPTVVHTGHGDSTTIAAEAPSLRYGGGRAQSRESGHTFPKRARQQRSCGDQAEQTRGRPAPCEAVVRIVYSGARHAHPNEPGRHHDRLERPDREPDDATR